MRTCLRARPGPESSVPQLLRDLLIAGGRVYYSLWFC
jgi:hypothetical protein